jgi:hypothetical protein
VAAWSLVAPLDFQEVTDDASGMGTMRIAYTAYAMDGLQLGYSYAPGELAQGTQHSKDTVHHTGLNTRGLFAERCKLISPFEGRFTLTKIDHGFRPCSQGAISN